MSRTSATEFAQALPVRCDDPMFRIQRLAENRAARNGRDPVAAGRAAMALLKLEPDGKIEHILCVVAGEFKSTAATVGAHELPPVVAT